MNDDLLTKMLNMKRQLVVANELLKYDQMAHQLRLQRLEQELDMLYSEAVASSHNAKAASMVREVGRSSGIV